MLHYHLIYSDSTLIPHTPRKRSSTSRSKDLTASEGEDAPCPSCWQSQHEGNGSQLWLVQHGWTRALEMPVRGACHVILAMWASRQDAIVASVALGARLTRGLNILNTLLIEQQRELAIN